MLIGYGFSNPLVRSGLDATKGRTGCEESWNLLSVRSDSGAGQQVTDCFARTAT